MIKYPIVYEYGMLDYCGYIIRPWRSWITQQIPILKIGGSNPFGRAKQGQYEHYHIIYWFGCDRHCPTGIKTPHARMEAKSAA